MLRAPFLFSPVQASRRGFATEAGPPEFGLIFLTAGEAHTWNLMLTPVHLVTMHLHYMVIKSLFNPALPVFPVFLMY